MEANQTVLMVKAQVLAEQIHPDGTPPANVIQLLQNILAALMSFLQGCGQTPTQALATARNPGLFARRKVRNVTRQELQAHPDLANYQPKIEEGVFNLAKNSTVKEVQSMYEEVSQ